jgi:hypothetical protein
MRAAASRTEASDARSSDTGSSDTPGISARIEARVLGLGLVARGHHALRALARELPRHLQPAPSVRARHDGEPPRQVGDVRRSPSHARW